VTDDRPFWFDWDYDREYASGGNSRYAIYLRDRDQAFREFWTDDPTVEFAALAWRIATGPILVPPLVRFHPRILGAHLSRSGWNGEMVADVELVAPRPQPLTNAKTAGGGWYRDNEIGSWGRYEGVGEQDLTRHAYLTTTVQMLWQLPAGTLPTVAVVPDAGDALFRTAVECLEVLVGVLNREVGPVIDVLEPPRAGSGE
jgi:hypothetical protein